MELANTSKAHYIDYVNQFVPIQPGVRVLEVGCGDGGNLLPFAERRCKVTGIDQAKERVKMATDFFYLLHKEAKFMAINFFEMKSESEDDKYDIVLIHDVIEHISDKDAFFAHVKQFVAKDGIIFWGFPAWQMPFGGHQQICHSSICSKLPFIHLLPVSIYRGLLSAFGEPKSCIDELLDIKQCRVSIENFEKLCKRNNHIIADRCFWFINPHYEQKFSLKPRKLSPVFNIKYLRNFFTTSCFYITKCE